MRTSNIAITPIVLYINNQEHLLLKYNSKWDDYSFVGGHVEADEINNWSLTAVKEAVEEIPGIIPGVDFYVYKRKENDFMSVKTSESVGETTLYRFRIFDFVFVRDPTEIISKLDFSFELFPVLDRNKSPKIAPLVKEISNHRLFTLSWHKNVTL